MNFRLGRKQTRRLADSQRRISDVASPTVIAHVGACRGRFRRAAKRATPKAPRRAPTRGGTGRGQGGTGG